MIEILRQILIKNPNFIKNLFNKSPTEINYNIKVQIHIMLKTKINFRIEMTDKTGMTKTNEME